MTQSTQPLVFSYLKNQEIFLKSFVSKKESTNTESCIVRTTLRFEGALTAHIRVLSSNFCKADLWTLDVEKLSLLISANSGPNFVKQKKLII